ncbi:MAG TPA: DUF2059 domain-containing protein [Candidatus Acidoferrum sp.]|nr:DUF2059 domain-containing protein [Candidatus Acidoferrum sp.]
MKRILMVVLVLLWTSSVGFAQQSSADSPASKEDIQRYLEVMHSREMMSKMVDAMMQPLHQMMHEQYEKNKDKLPADFEARLNRELDDFLKEFPWNEMLQAMVPVYQKHFTKGDVDNLVAFYSGPTGQKLLRELPAITAESMQAMMPIMEQRMQALQQRMQQQAAEMIMESQRKSGQSQPNLKE